MIRRALLHSILTLALILSGLTAVVAETRMAAAGTFCGTDAPRLLLDASGLPHLDGQGQAIAAPECPACNLTLVVLTPTPPAPTVPRVLRPKRTSLTPSHLSPLVVHRGAQPRAPPRVA